MLRSGLVSVTFRRLAPAEIVALVVRAGLEGIEWGGDVHVPHGDLDAARRVRRLTEDAGLRVAAYGSYYRAGHEEPAPFESVLATAAALGAPTIRVWAGKQGSADADAAYREQVAEDARRIAGLAAREGIAVAFEFHGNTLTDTPDSAVALLRAAGHENLGTYWQQPGGLTADECLETLRAVGPWLSNLHVFWTGRRPLAGGSDAWRRYLQCVAALGGERYAMIEFVRDDLPEAFLEDAAALRQWLGCSWE